MIRKQIYSIFLLTLSIFFILSGCSQPNPTPIPTKIAEVEPTGTVLPPSPTFTREKSTVETPTQTAVSPTLTHTPLPTETPTSPPTATPTLTPTPTRAMINSGNADQLTAQQTLTTKGQLYDVLISPDKSLMLITSETGVRVYETAVFDLLHEFSIQVSENTIMAWSPDSQRVALIDEAGILTVWEQGRAEFVQRSDGSQPIALVWSPDSSLLAVGLQDSAIQIWQAANGSTPITLSGHTEPVTQLAWSPDGSSLASGSADDMVRLWEVDVENGNGVETAVFTGHSSDINLLAWSPDSIKLAARSRGDFLMWWDVETGEALDRQLNVADLTWYPDSSHIALVRGAAVDVKTAVGEPAYSLSGHSSNISHIAWSPTDPNLLVTAGRDKQIIIWDIAAQASKHKLFGHEKQINHIAWSPDGLQITSADENWVWIWDVMTGDAQNQLSRHLEITQAAWLANEIVLTVGSFMDNLVRSWHAGNGNNQAVIGHYSNYDFNAPITISWSPDNQYMAVLSDDGVTRIWNTKTNQIVQAIFGHVLGYSGDRANITNAVNDITWSPDSIRLATASSDHTIRIWDAATAHESAILPHELDVVVHAWSPDGTQIVSIGAGDSPVSSQLHLWDVQTGELIWKRDIPVKTPNDLLWSPDGTKIAIGIGEGNSSIQIREAIEGETVSRLQWDGEVGVWDIDWSPDGNRMLSGSPEGDVHLWDTTFFDLTTGQLLTTLPEAHARDTIGVSWFHDSDGFASLGADGDLRLWSAPVDKVEATVVWEQDGFFVQPVEDPREIPIRLTAGKRIYLEMSPDGTQLAVVTAENIIQIFGVGP